MSNPSSVLLPLTWPGCVEYLSKSSSPQLPPSQSRATQPTDPVTTYNGRPLKELSKVLGKEPHLSKNEIRLLDLCPGPTGTLLRGKLRKVKLPAEGARPEYEPLSYTWQDHGTDDDTDYGYAGPYLYLDEEYNVSLRLQPNCAKALYHIRHAQRGRTLWVDSICINQDDDLEKSQQVLLMSLIYSRAPTVIVYVGHRSKLHDSDLALRLLRRPERLKGALSEVEKASLTHFFGRPYFQRIWIVQEFALATALNIICGPDGLHVSEYTRSTLKDFLRSVTQTELPAWFSHSRQINIHIEQNGPARAKELIDLIFHTASCKYSEPKDRIFALFGLLRGAANNEDLSPSSMPVADYMQSVDQVYTGTAAFLIMNGFLGTVLNLATLTRRQTDGNNFEWESHTNLDSWDASSIRHYVNRGASGLPSWVPDWSKVTDDMQHSSKPDSNVFWDLYSSDDASDTRSGLPLLGLSSSSLGHGMKSDSERSDTKIWNNGVLEVRGLLLHEHQEHKTQDHCCAVIVPAPDVSTTQMVEHRSSVSAWFVEQQHTQANRRDWPELDISPDGNCRGQEFDSLLSKEHRQSIQGDRDLHIEISLEDFPLRPSPLAGPTYSQVSHFTDSAWKALTPSDRRLHSQLSPKNLTQLESWPGADLWTGEVPRLRADIVRAICNNEMVGIGRLCRLESLWKKWQEQASYGLWILGNRDIIQEAIQEIESIELSKKNFHPARPFRWRHSLIRRRFCDPDAWAGVAFASFLGLFMNDPEIPRRECDSVSDLPEPQCDGRQPLRHLLAWAETTFALFVELEKDRSFLDLIKDETGIPRHFTWAAAEQTFYYHLKTNAKKWKSGYHSSMKSWAVLLLERIQSECGASRPTTTIERDKSYWSWSGLSGWINAHLEFWGSKLEDFETIRRLRGSMVYGEWKELMSKFERMDEFGAHLYELDWTTFTIP